MDRVTLDPGAEEERLVRNVVLGLAGLDAAVAADALVDVDAHAVPVVGRVVARCGRGRWVLACGLADSALNTPAAGKNTIASLRNSRLFIWVPRAGGRNGTASTGTCRPCAAMSIRALAAAGSSDPAAWQRPQNSRLSGLVGSACRGLIMCCSPTWWHSAQGSSACSESALVRSIRPWQPPQSCGVSGGTGSCGSWHDTQRFFGLCFWGSTCGKPLGRADW